MPHWKVYTFWYCVATDEVPSLIQIEEQIKVTQEVVFSGNI